ncbi:MAG TPA: MaoC family dehydratase [Actinophytocola sp.]|uniref:MaoC family dehydratase n=1 Tax=Actinophytocola sp. TaxID=1872138 RepID=UPI002DDCCB14|nr:MaoC family dehydratase [Actinophytocola sp.]HEV2779905.1 MaoC family dehydratase [Actinophytocola sp.]
MKVFTGAAELAAAAGQRLGASGFRTVDQREIDAFAAVTGDHQWIHVDRRRAGAGPFGRTIAHGMLTLSLGITMLTEVFRVDGAEVVLHKGFDRVRFATPVPSGARVRLVADLVEVKPLAHHYTEAVLAVALEIEGQSRPAYTAHTRLLYREAKPCGAS